MKQVWLGLFLLSSGLGFGVEVSVKKDICVLKSTAECVFPAELLPVFDESLKEKFRVMPRFELKAYDYRMTSTTAEEFAARLKALKSATTAKGEVFIDPVTGTNNISAEDMAYMAGSTFVIVPVIRSFGVIENAATIDPITGKKTIDLSPNRRVNNSGGNLKYYINVQFYVIDENGDILKNFLIGATSTDSSDNKFNIQNAMNSSVAQFAAMLRTSDGYKLKSRVLKPGIGAVYLQLGRDMGIYEGEEFEIRTPLNSGFKTSGLVRVSEVLEDHSMASIVFGSPQVNDQLVEAPLSGARLEFRVAMDAYSSRVSNLQFISGSNWTKTFNPLPSTIELGFRVEGELGYAGYGFFGSGILFNDPIGFFMNGGAGYELQFYNLSLGLNLGAQMSFLSIDMGKGYMTPSGSMDNLYGTIRLNCLYLGLKPEASVGIRLTQGLMLRVFGSYTWNPLKFSFVNFDPDRKDEPSYSIDKEHTSYQIRGNGEVRNSFEEVFSLEGFNYGMDFVFRF